ncbi:hypothetical protein CEXT_493601 [Caerostris extrusa]|uniref:Ribosomal protein S14 n=1 Tax=Caerostris extrusa TaxID=172846 RepID=A0AAV4S7P4_CAEEX|nr:hypothetical protein CEXT_493601 [Caerostris extrusa]
METISNFDFEKVWHLKRVDRYCYRKEKKSIRNTAEARRDFFPRRKIHYAGACSLIRKSNKSCYRVLTFCILPFQSLTDINTIPTKLVFHPWQKGMKKIISAENSLAIKGFNCDGWILAGVLVTHA